jgi:hypothetical protein
MRKKTLPIFLAATLTLAAAAPVIAAIVTENFSGLPIDTCYSDGTVVGAWKSVFDGFGCNATVFLEGNAVLLERPAASVSPYETHGGLVVGPAINGDFTLQVSAATNVQLRTGSAPNPWEVAWLLWHYVDNSHFYYFIPKPNGWELGKADPAYPGAQRFLATGSSPSFPIGAWYRVSIVQSGQTIQVSVNGATVTTFTDRERAYSSGRVGLYTEDAEGYFDDVTLTTAAGKGKKGR